MRPRARHCVPPWLLGVLLAALASMGGAAQQPTANAPKPLTAADYARAEKFLGTSATSLVFKTSVRPTWITPGQAGQAGTSSDDTFWYRNANADGTSEIVLVDPGKGTRVVCAPAMPECRGAIASAASAAATTPTGRGAGGQAAGRAGGQAGRGGQGAGAPSVASPDGKRAVFIRNDNLFVRDVATGAERALTTDGVKDFGYATDNAGWAKSDRPVVLWSPDSKKVFTFQQDQRGVGEMYLVRTEVGHPQLEAWKYPLPGDKVITMIQRVVIDVDAGRVVRLQMPPDQHRSTLCDNVNCGNFGDVQWNPDGSSVAFISTSRDHRNEALYVADAATGTIRKVFEETVSTFYESGNGAVNFKYLPASNEFIWFSEQSNWGQVYLYDLSTGKLKNQITTGVGNVTQIQKLDTQNRVIYFMGVGKEKGRDPYFVHLYKVGFDGTGQALLTPDDGNHGIEWSPSGKYFIDTYSKPETPQTIVLRDLNGTLVTPLEKADITKLVATGWKPPVAFSVKCRDHQTDCYGLMFTPTNLDQTKKYPIVNHIYPGPQTGSVGSRNFAAAHGDCEALAELGVIVVEIDGMGTPWRTKKFHEAYYGDMGDNTLPDQVAGMKELATRYPYIDLDRVGIYGHSGGGFAAAGAMFHYPDFFQVGISESGNHDNREYEDDWAEKWSPLLETKPDGTSNYDSQANQNFAKNLKGRLLLAHGTMDANVPPYNTLLVVDALIKANKDFDLIMLPNQGHGYGSESNYMTRRRWDYFTRYLLGAEPPKDYEIGASAAGRRGGGPR